MKNLPTYPEYKETDIPWLGEIPVHWEVVPTELFQRKMRKIILKNNALRRSSCVISKRKNFWLTVRKRMVLYLDI